MKLDERPRIRNESCRACLADDQDRATAIAVAQAAEDRARPRAGTSDRRRRAGQSGLPRTHTAWRKGASKGMTMLKPSRSIRTIAITTPSGRH